MKRRWKLKAGSDVCGRVWIEDAENGRFDAGVHIGFPQHDRKRKVAEMVELAELLAEAPEVRRRHDMLIEAARAVLDEIEPTMDGSVDGDYIGGALYHSDPSIKALRVVLRSCAPEGEDQ